MDLKIQMRNRIGPTVLNISGTNQISKKTGSCRILHFNVSNTFYRSFIFTVILKNNIIEKVVWWARG